VQKTNYFPKKANKNTEWMFDETENVHSFHR